MGAPLAASTSTSIVDGPDAGGSPIVVLRTERPCAMTTGAVTTNAAREA